MLHNVLPKIFLFAVFRPSATAEIEVTRSSALKIIWIIFSDKHYLVTVFLKCLIFLHDVEKCKVCLKNNSNNFSENLFTTFLAHFDGKSKFIWIILFKNHYSVTGFLKHLSFLHDVEKFKVFLKNNRNIFLQKYVHNFSPTFGWKTYKKSLLGNHLSEMSNFLTWCRKM